MHCGDFVTRIFVLKKATHFSRLFGQEFIYFLTNVLGIQASHLTISLNYRFPFLFCGLIKWFRFIHVHIGNCEFYSNLLISFGYYTHQYKK